MNSYIVKCNSSRGRTLYVNRTSPNIGYAASIESALPMTRQFAHAIARTVPQVSGYKATVIEWKKKLAI